MPVGSIQEDDESYAKSTKGTVSSNTKDSAVKVLGLNWNTKSDEFYFEYDELYDYRNYSNKRRGVYYIFGAQGAAFIRGRRLFEGGVYCKFCNNKCAFIV